MPERDANQLRGPRREDETWDEYIARTSAPERDANQLAADATEHRSSSDYIDRTIETVRNHREADNCWPQWANIFADEIEDLRTDRERLVALVGTLQQERAAERRWCKHWAERAEAAEAALADTLEVVSALTDRVENAEAALATTRQALARFGRHGMFCAWSDGKACDCGLADALADTGGDTNLVTYDELRGYVHGGAMRSKSPAPGQGGDTKEPA